MPVLTVQGPTGDHPGLDLPGRPLRRVVADPATATRCPKGPLVTQRNVRAGSAAELLADPRAPTRESATTTLTPGSGSHTQLLSGSLPSRVEQASEAIATAAS